MADVIGATGRPTPPLRGPRALHRIFAVVDVAAALSGALVGGVAAGLGPGGATALGLAAALAYQYAAGWSLARDLELLLATIPAVLSGRGAF